MILSYACDTETTVYKNQKDTEVWACGAAQIGDKSDTCHIFNHIALLFDFLRTRGGDTLSYFHNLRFDGEFLVHYLLDKLHYSPAIVASYGNTIEWEKSRFMKNNTFRTSISDMGEWYSMTVKSNGKLLEFRDSYKLIPLSIKDMGKSFKTKHQKLDIEYEGERHAGGVITDEEEAYLKNDILVLKEGLEAMFAEGHDRLTIGSCGLNEFKKTIILDEFRKLFPDLSTYFSTSFIECEASKEYKNIDEYIRKSYHGAWCYVREDIKGKIVHNGKTVDVNSLYPYSMHSMSGNVYPFGTPEFWQGDFIPDEALKPNRYYFIRIKTRFYLRKGFLPFIQIKKSFRYNATEYLKTSDFYNTKTGEYSTTYIDKHGEEQITDVILTLSCTDFELIKKHYHLVNCRILDGCYFQARAGFFDDYINKYREMKENSEGGRRTIAKLLQNALYGKMASGLNNGCKVPYLDESGAVHYTLKKEGERKPVYIPIGAAITSYARAYTITKAQKNIKYFAYADTDSIHGFSPDGSDFDFVDIELDQKRYGAFKIETRWESAKFIRPKAYVERVVVSDEKPCKPYYLIKSGGLPPRSKELIAYSLSDDEERKNFDWKYKHSERGMKFAEKHRTMDDIGSGLKVPDKLLPAHYPGGIVLEESDFTYK